MRAGIALLADDNFQHKFQERYDAICRDYGLMPDNHGFWPHVSLKMPFVTADFIGVRAYLQEFSATVQPMTLTLTGVDLWTTPGQDNESGVLFLKVAEQDALRALHLRLNQELSERFVNTQAPYDGMEFHFHLTLATGGASVETYRHILETERRHWPPSTCHSDMLALASQDEAAPEKGWQRAGTHFLRVLP